MDESLEYKVPGALIGVSMLIYGAFFYWHLGGEGLVVGSLIMISATIIEVILALGACFITAKLLGTSFGNLGSAIVKLTAIVLFPSAVGLILPGGWIWTIIFYLGLLYALFDLDGWEPIYFAVILYAIERLVLMFVLPALSE